MTAQYLLEESGIVAILLFVNDVLKKNEALVYSALADKQIPVYLVWHDDRTGKSIYTIERLMGIDRRSEDKTPILEYRQEMSLYEFTEWKRILHCDYRHIRRERLDTIAPLTYIEKVKYL